MDANNQDKHDAPADDPRGMKAGMSDTKIRRTNITEQLQGGREPRVMNQTNPAFWRVRRPNIAQFYNVHYSFKSKAREASL